MLKNVISFKTKISLFLSVAIVCFFVAFILSRSDFFTKNYFENKTHFETILKQKELRVTYLLSNISKKNEISDFDYFNHNNIANYSSLYEKEGIVLLIYDKNKLKFWSNNSVSFNNSLLKNKQIDEVQFLGNGWYRVIRQIEGTKTYFGLILLKLEYSFQNQYIKNEFANGFNIPDNYKITTKKPSKYGAISSSEGKFLCNLEYNKTTENSWKKAMLSSIFYFISLIFIFAFLQHISLFFYQKNHSLLFPIFFISVILAIRYAMLQFGFPDSFYLLETFSPKQYATSFVSPSFGDFLINTVLLFYLVVYFNLCVKISINPTKKTGIQNYLIVVLVFLLLFTIGDFVFGMYSGLVLNSVIPLDIGRILEFNLYSFLSFFSVGILFISLFMLSKKIVEIIKNISGSIYFYIICLLIAGFAYILISIIISSYSPLNIMATLSILLPILFFSIRNKSMTTFGRVMFFVFIFSVFATIILNELLNYKEKENRKSLAIKLAVEQDPIAEYIFSDIEKNMVNDTILHKYLSNPIIDETAVTNRFMQKYFYGYWAKYDMQFTICRSIDSLMIKPDNIQRSCFSFFDNIIKVAKPTLSCDLYYLNKGTGRISYIAKLAMPDKKNWFVNSARIYVELDSKFVPKGIGYPELLLDKKFSSNIDLGNYSYARYVNKELVTQYGKYLYALSDPFWTRATDEFTFIESNDFDQLVYKVDANSMVVLGKKSNTIIDIVAPFSYLFGFFSILTLLVMGADHIRRKTFHFFQANFKSRVQFSMSFIVFISLLIIGTSTVFYILNLFNNDNRENIKEKSHSVLVELENILGKEQVLSSNMSDYLTDLLIKFSNIYFIDFNLYNLNGNLLASSRPKVFDEGLISRKINPIAFNELLVNNQTLFINEEKIGSLRYISAYAPFRNNNNQILGYVNLPYFGQQNERDKELATFLVALINIYVLLFVLALLLALAISNRITLPLTIIRERIANIKFGNSSEPIVWKSKDEIGSLIEDYNRMVVELAKSAELLAKSEREGAWREMAKQVAHEIKNPLTPMKLSVQFLQRAWNDKKEDFDERLKRFTDAIIEQIDTLSAIATEFSNFAKISAATPEKIELVSFLKQTTDLYKGFDNASVLLQTELPEKSFILFDRTQLTRVLTNLIKNSFQAIPEDVAGIINIAIQAEKDEWIIRVADNGIGIPEDQISKIFSPNFTTKSSGMGLGLAMVKSIVDTYNGRIWFDTKVGVGTTFFIAFKQLEENE